MPKYQAPLREIRFVLNEVLDIGRFANLPGFENAIARHGRGNPDRRREVSLKRCCSRSTMSGDQQGCTRHADGSVTTPDGFKDAYRPILRRRLGDFGRRRSNMAGRECRMSSRWRLKNIWRARTWPLPCIRGLSSGAVSAMLVKGSDELKAKYAPNMISGKWTGTMNLTEPHCGTDLGLIRTKAVPNGDGSYAISGTKIFISSGEHDLTENIIHLVLAKTPDAPDNVKGISLFIVPKFLVNEDGSLGARNALSCGSIEHKMGIHGNSTCVMNYDGATGYLVGEENKGLAAMFIMMNIARLGVGQQGLGRPKSPIRMQCNMRMTAGRAAH